VKFWLPYTIGNSGSDVSIKQLALALEKLGHTAIAEGFPHKYQYIPWLLTKNNAPDKTDCIIGNSWNAFAFKKQGIPLITVERLFVLDKEYTPYKSIPQSLFHRFILSHWLKSSYKKSDAVIALSKSTADGIRSVFNWAKPVVILNAVDIDFFSPASNTEQRPAILPLKVLYVGNLSKRKGTDLLPKIMDALGEKIQLSYTEDRNQLNGIDHLNAICIGRLDLQGVKKAYINADLLILPTRLEGLPRAAMEAIACGTPVISSDASSLPELVINGVSGYTCEKDNVDEFVKRITEIIYEPSALLTLSNSAREYAINHLDLNLMAQKYVELTEQLIRSRNEPNN